MRLLGHDIIYVDVVVVREEYNNKLGVWKVCVCVCVWSWSAYPVLPCNLRIMTPSFAKRPDDSSRFYSYNKISTYFTSGSMATLHGVIIFKSNWILFVLMNKKISHVSGMENCLGYKLTKFFKNLFKI
jgi:hypothetical protein